jgi:hypothetical protein
MRFYWISKMRLPWWYSNWQESLDLPWWTKTDREVWTFPDGTVVDRKILSLPWRCNNRRKHFLWRKRKNRQGNSFLTVVTVREWFLTVFCQGRLTFPDSLSLMTDPWRLPSGIAFCDGFGHFLWRLWPSGKKIPRVVTSHFLILLGWKEALLLLVLLFKDRPG